MRLPRISLEWHPNENYAELHMRDGSPIYGSGRYGFSFSVTRREIQALILDLQSEIDNWTRSTNA